MAYPTKSQLRLLLADGKTKKVLDAIQKIAASISDHELERGAVHQLSRWNQLEQEVQDGVILYENTQTTRNQITSAAGNLIDDLPDDYPTEAKSTSATSAPTTAASSTALQDKPSYKVPLAVGIFFLLLIILLITWIPEPSDYQYNFYRVAIAIGAAGIAAVIPGFFEWRYKAWSFGGALGIFILVLYVLQPTQKNTEPFNFTVQLRTINGLDISSSYPDLANGKLRIFVRNQFAEASISEQLIANFINIEPAFANNEAFIKLDAPYWKLQKDSVLLVPNNSQTLYIEPNGILANVEGKVKSIDGNDFLPDAIIEIEGVLDTTDERGNFSIPIPTEKQKIRYIYSAQKQGYETKTEPFDFDGEAIEIRMKKQ